MHSPSIALSNRTLEVDIPQNKTKVLATTTRTTAGCSLCITRRRFTCDLDLVPLVCVQLAPRLPRQADGRDEPVGAVNVGRLVQGEHGHVEVGPPGDVSRTLVPRVDRAPAHQAQLHVQGVFVVEVSVSQADGVTSIVIFVENTCVYLLLDLSVWWSLISSTGMYTLETQWAAVRTWSGEMRDPPQKCSHLPVDGWNLRTVLRKQSTFDKVMKTS